MLLTLLPDLATYKVWQEPITLGSLTTQIGSINSIFVKEKIKVKIKKVKPVVKSPAFQVRCWF